MRQPALLLLLALSPALAACSRSAGVFSEQNARAHVSMLAGTIGSRPVGSEANARARAYVIDQLKLYGYDVRVQEIDAHRPEIGRTAHVSNIIATLSGRRPEAFGLVSHYDSAPESPGAADDGLGVAVVLETARVLAARSERQWTTFVLVTDGEEASLMGAAAVVTDHVIASNLKAYINVEAAGSDGAAVLFQTGPGNGWLTGAWARRAPHPRGGSFGIEVYRRLPNDTDFTILARENIAGLNFAAVDDGYSYHTARDEPDRLTSRSLRTTGENIAAVAVALDGMDITKRERWEATYFDIGRVSALSYGMVMSWVIDAAALLLGVAAWIRIMSAALRVAGPLRWIVAAASALIGAAVAVFSMIGATWALRAGREVYHPWYAHPNRLLFLLVAVGLTAAWGIVRIGAMLPMRIRGIRDPTITWSLTLPIWILLAAGATWFTPSAAYLWTVPLLAAGMTLIAIPASRRRGPDSGSPIPDPDLVRMASIVVLAVTGTLWLRNTVDLVQFATAVFGRLPLIMPAYVFAAIIAAAGLMVIPPVMAAVSRRSPIRRPALVSAFCLAATAIATAAAALAPAYTYERPLRRHVRALQEPDGARATWEVASIEPGLDLAAGAPTGWSLQKDTAAASIPWGRFSDPFVFRTDAEPLGPAPADVTSFTITPSEGAVDIAVSVVPRRGALAISFVLPTGLTPSRSSLPGVQRAGQWVATFVAPPPEGIAWRAAFRGAEVARLADLRVVVTDSGFPGGIGWQRLPAWLPQEHVVWAATATWAVRPSAGAPVEPVPALR
ncbi:MAG: M28 family peptidase [Vicinamibacterales bacterium]